ncbi:hypothetical protein RPATATE_0231 [Rickettsia parkeri str. Tate's Hell]|uniref:Uncharacterized protein n=1 Tax=Rickettsia parkeri str. Tate's Hell TaxID=1359189 RepID=A0ABR5DNB4_RICPA|nr:hypothetical protein RPATATE_0231 [Rickettsia parkeri str. Tate's Hell]
MLDRWIDSTQLIPSIPSIKLYILIKPLKAITKIEYISICTEFSCEKRKIAKAAQIKWTIKRIRIGTAFKSSKKEIEAIANNNGNIFIELTKLLLVIYSNPLKAIITTTTIARPPPRGVILS